MNKAVTFSLMTLATVIIAAIGARIRAAVDAQIPEGYEDDKGFHFGPPNFRN